MRWLERPMVWWGLARVQPNKQKADHENFLRKAAVWVRQEPGLRDRIDLTKPQSPMTLGIALNPASNAMGEFVANMTYHNWMNMTDLQAINTTAAMMLDVALAITQWRNDTSDAGLPPTLAALAPRYLEAEPVDPFSGKPFGYDPARGFLWSVGLDGVDTGGQDPLLTNPQFSFSHELREGGSGTLDLGRLFELGKQRKE